MKLHWKTHLWLGCLALLMLTAPATAVSAQDEAPQGPVYIVEEGDTLSGIALRFGITVDDLVAANNLPDANTVFVGDRLVIPGLEGIVGILETATVAVGQNLRSFSRAYGIPPDLFIRLNRLVSPAELHSGASVVVTRGQTLPDPYRVSLSVGESLLEMAVRLGANPWSFGAANGISSPMRAVPGDVLFTSRSGDQGALGLPPAVAAVSLNTLYQGEAAVLRVAAQEQLSFSGRLGPYTLAFVSAGAEQVALQGVDALLEPGMYPLRLEAALPDGNTFAYTQMVRVYPRDYIFEYITVDPYLIDPDVTEAENASLVSLLATVTPDRLWDGLFQPPSPFEDCINSTFGNRRSYNGSAFIYYHSGVDFCGGTGVEIFAPAPGIVLYTAALDVRGNYTLIDHGWGVLTAYMHQSEILVEVGEQVAAGQVIGLVGSTGRSTGSHLHWEVWVHGVAVNPLDWLSETYP